MAGKYALYLPYKVLNSLSGGNVTDSEFREFIMGLAEYDKSGTFPASHTAGFAMMFELLKTDLDFAKAKYEDIVEKRRQAGKRGGAPKGNKNAAGNRGGRAPRGNRNATKQPKHLFGLSENKLNPMLEFKTNTTSEKTNTTSEKTNTTSEKTNTTSENLHQISVRNSLPDNELLKQTQAKQAKQAKQADNSKQITDIRSSSSVAPAGGDGVVLEKQPTTTTTESILKTCEEMGFPMTNSGAQRIQDMGIDPGWLTEPYSFIKNTVEFIQEMYDEKPLEEQKRLFFSALQWEDRQEEFPAWREQQIAAAARREDRRRKEAALEAQEAAERKQIEQERGSVSLSADFQAMIQSRGASP